MEQLVITETNMSNPSSLEPSKLDRRSFLAASAVPVMAMVGLSQPVLASSTGSATGAVDDYLKAHLFGSIFSRDNLDWSSRELATLAALASPEGLDSQLQSHMSISLNVGLTEGQLRQASDVLGMRVSPGAGQRADAALQRALAGRK